MTIYYHPVWKGEICWRWLLGKYCIFSLQAFWKFFILNLLETVASIKNRFFFKGNQTKIFWKFLRTNYLPGTMLLQIFCDMYLRLFLKEYSKYIKFQWSSYVFVNILFMANTLIRYSKAICWEQKYNFIFMLNKLRNTS